MDLRAKLKRWMKLGFFVGAGTVAAVVSACDSAVKKLDTGPPRDTAVVDAGQPDQGQDKDLQKTDAAVADKASPQPDAGAPDKQPGWDIPLE